MIRYTVRTVFSATAWLALALGAMAWTVSPAPAEDLADAAAEAAATQDAALRLARQVDLPALEKADRAVIEQLFPDTKQATIQDAAVLKNLRAALVVKNVPPSAGESQYEVSFFHGKTPLRKVWVYGDGEWGFTRSKPPHWTTGANARLSNLLAELLGTAAQK